MQNTDSIVRVNPDRISIDTDQLVDALDPDTISDLSRPAAVAEIVHALTDHPVTYAEAELVGPADMDIRFSDSGVLVEHAAIQLLRRESLSVSGIAPDAVLPLADATPPVEHGRADVIAVDASLIYETVDLNLNVGEQA
jgi:hypothetical protein